MINYIKKNKYICILLIILIVGIFLRAYNYSDWLHFELDQARDAKIVDLALDEGVDNLPLLGPRAAGTFLRLGPASYYFSYITAFLFGGSPPAMASISLICGVGAIYLMYLFSRRYFKIKISLAITSVFSLSLFLIMYSRFMWNPNLIPFFVLLAGYSLLKVVDNHEEKKTLWLSVAALSVAIATQLHFVVFMGLPVIVVLFLLIRRPKIKLVSWLVAAGIFLLVYSPVIINDVKTGGANFQEFIGAFTEKTDEEESKHNVTEKVIMAYNEVSRASFLMMTGIDKGPLNITDKKGSLAFTIDCDYTCRQRFPWSLFASILFLVALIAFILKFYLYVIKKDPTITKQKKDFLILTAVWSVICFGLFVQIAYDIAPRFFLFVAPIIFVYLGFILKIIHKYVSLKAVYVLVVVLLVLNSFAIYERFYQLSQSHIQRIDYPYDGILKEPVRVTYMQQNLIVDYMEKNHKTNGYPIYLKGDSRYHRSLSYLVNKRDINVDGLKLSSEVYAQGNHYLISVDGKNLESKIDKYRQTYEVLSRKSFGSLIVVHLEPKVEAVTAEYKDFSIPEKSSSSAPKRYLWNEIFN